MIFANINDQTTNFICQNQYLAKVFKWLQETNLKTLAVGKYNISDGIFVKIQEYNTKKEIDGRFENHEDHLDFHFLIMGKEITRVIRPDSLTQIDNALGTLEDVAHYKRFDGQASSICLNPGDYLILFPEDAHEACLNLADQSVACKKAVIKVPIKLFKYWFLFKFNKDNKYKIKLIEKIWINKKILPVIYGKEVRVFNYKHFGVMRLLSSEMIQLINYINR